MLDHGGDRQRGQGIDDPLDGLVGQHNRIAVPDLDAPVGAEGVVPHGLAPCRLPLVASGSGQTSPRRVSYSQQCAIDFMKKHPDGRAIFMLRDPARRLMSSFRFYQGMYQEYPDSEFDEFTNALLNIGQTRDIYRDRISKDFFKELFSAEIEMGRYINHIRRWQSELPEDDLVAQIRGQMLTTVFVPITDTLNAT